MDAGACCEGLVLLYNIYCTHYFLRCGFCWATLLRLDDTKLDAARTVFSVPVGKKNLLDVLLMFFCLVASFFLIVLLKMSARQEACFSQFWSVLG